MAIGDCKLHDPRDVYLLKWLTGIRTFHRISFPNRKNMFDVVVSGGSDVARAEKMLRQV